MIILEGPDGAGKTTLANTLSERLNIAIHHSGGPPNKEKGPDEIFHRMEELIANLDAQKPLIYDRVSVISDSVYGPIIRGSTPFEGTDYASRLFHALRMPIIYCRPSMSRLLLVEYGHAASGNNPGEDDQHIQGVIKNQRKLVQQYDRSMGYYPHWTYDFMGEQSTITLDNLIMLIRFHLAEEGLDV